MPRYRTKSTSGILAGAKPPTLLCVFPFKFFSACVVLCVSLPHPTHIASLNKQNLDRIHAEKEASGLRRLPAGSERSSRDGPGKLKSRVSDDVFQTLVYCCKPLRESEVQHLGETSDMALIMLLKLQAPPMRVRNK